MSVRFEFYLSDEDTDRLFAVKEDKGKNDLTGNEYAKELLLGVLYKLHPARVQYDDDTGKELNKVVPAIKILVADR